MFKELSEIEVYILAEDFTNRLWEIIVSWEYFVRDTIGKQFIRAADSISANIAESHGRFHYQDKKNFGYFARGSYEETKSWLRKAIARNLISDFQKEELINDLEKIGPKLNALINSFKSPRNKEN